MTYPTQNEVSDLEEFFKKHPEELVNESKYDKDLKNLQETLKDLKIKGIITDENSNI